MDFARYFLKHENLLCVVPANRPKAQPPNSKCRRACAKPQTSRPFRFIEPGGYRRRRYRMIKQGTRFQRWTSFIAIRLRERKNQRSFSRKIILSRFWWAAFLDAGRFGTVLPIPLPLHFTVCFFSMARSASNVLSIPSSNGTRGAHPRT